MVVGSQATLKTPSLPFCIAYTQLKTAIAQLTSKGACKEMAASYAQQKRPAVAVKVHV
jgi:hypothetical protein